MSNSETNFLVPRRWVVMGVSGCGKTEIGRMLARRLGIAYEEGDDYHPPTNITKMAAGMPLDDADRYSWLKMLQTKIRASANSGLVLSCSSLKRRYRDLLREADPSLIFIHLDGPPALIAARMHARANHYMPTSLLGSQFAALERLETDEWGLCVDIALPPEQLVDIIVQNFGLVTRKEPTGDKNEAYRPVPRAHG